MRLTERLFGFLNRVFSRDPEKVLALRIRYDGQMTITVSDAVLTTQVVGGSGQAITANLRDYTIAQLAAFVAAQPGYTVEYENGQFGAVGAHVLLDVVTDQDTSNGDHLYAYTSLLYAFLEAYAEELTTARHQVRQAIRQMAVPTAEGEWLDEIGSYFSVYRASGEPDSQYGPRIIAEVLRPKGNNIAIEEAIRIATGVPANVTDAELQTDIDIGGGTLADSYGLFDIEADIDLDTFDDPELIGQFASRVYNLIDVFRDAGTHLRNVSVNITSRAVQTIAMATVSGVDSEIYPDVMVDTFAASNRLHEIVEFELFDAVGSLV